MRCGSLANWTFLFFFLIFLHIKILIQNFLAEYTFICMKQHSFKHTWQNFLNVFLFVCLLCPRSCYKIEIYFDYYCLWTYRKLPYVIISCLYIIYVFVNNNKCKTSGLVFLFPLLFSNPHLFFSSFFPFPFSLSQSSSDIVQPSVYWNYTLEVKSSTQSQINWTLSSI